MSVNVSAYQMGPLLPDLVMAALNDSGLPAEALTLEMTETVLMERTDEMVALLEEFTVLGVNLAVDDFGTGYSSLSYLSRFPVDTLKIDRSFVESVGRSGERTELARTIVQLGAALDLDTVAEGIELAYQAEALASMGCTYGQGFYFSPPLTADELDAYLAQGDGYALPETHRPTTHRPRPPDCVPSPDAVGLRRPQGAVGRAGYVAGVGEDGRVRVDLEPLDLRDALAAAVEAVGGATPRGPGRHGRGRRPGDGLLARRPTVGKRPTDRSRRTTTPRPGGHSSAGPGRHGHGQVAGLPRTRRPALAADRRPRRRRDRDDRAATAARRA